MRCCCRRRRPSTRAGTPATTAQNQFFDVASSTEEGQTAEPPSPPVEPPSSPAKPPSSPAKSQASHESAVDDFDNAAVALSPQLVNLQQWLSSEQPPLVSNGEAATPCPASAELSVEDAVSQLVEVLDAPGTLKADAIRVLHALVGGAASHCSATRHPDPQTLELDFTHSLVGETATRSRVPVFWTLDRTLRLRSRLEDGSIIVETHGFGTMPLDGVKEGYAGVKAFWAEKGVPQGERRQRSKLAWEYWLAHKMEFEHTKMFRVLDSFTSLLSVRLTVPTYILEDILMGYLCATDVAISSIMFKTGKVGNTEVFASVVCTSDTTDSQSNFNLGFEMFVSGIVQNPAQLKFALKTSCSQCTFGLFFFGLRAAEHGYDAACGCDPVHLAKLFTVAKPEELGGARNGSKWQVADQTWELTGDKGRMFWHLQMVRQPSDRR